MLNEHEILECIFLFSFVNDFLVNKVLRLETGENLSMIDNALTPLSSQQFSNPIALFTIWLFLIYGS